MSASHSAESDQQPESPTNPKAYAALVYEPSGRDLLQPASPRETAIKEGQLWLLGWPALALLVVILYFCCLGRPPLFDPDEGRHAEIAREAIITGNWATPTLNLEPYHHKPMPFYWFVAAGLKSFASAPEFGARLPSALAAAATVLATTGWTTQFFGPQVGFLAGAILATTAAFVVAGRTVLVDMSFTWWVTAAHLSVGWLTFSARGKAFWPLPWICVGLAMLLKGPAAMVLLAGSAAFYASATKQWQWLRKLEPARGLALAGAVAGIWYFWAAVKAPDYMRDFLWIHNVERFVSGAPGHPRNFLYFAYILPLVFLPWSLWWPMAARPIFRALVQRNTALLFCAGWALSVIGFFSLSRSKLPTYILPSFPPLAVLTAAGLVAFFRDTPVPHWALRWTWAVHATLAVLATVAFASAWLALRALGEPEIGSATAIVAASASAVLVASYWWYRGKSVPVQRIAFVALAFVLAELSFYGIGASRVSARYSLHEAARALRSVHPEAELLAHDAVFNSLLFYSGRRVQRVETLNEAARLLGRDRPTVLLTKQNHLNEVVCYARVPLVAIWSGERNKVLLANRAAAPKPDNSWPALSGCKPDLGSLSPKL